MRWAFEHEMMVRRSGSGPELVWIHGLGEWSPSFEVVAAHPSLAGYTHVLVDLPGYGRSPWPPDSSELARSLARVADHLAAWLRSRPPAILAGHSMGGVLATLVAEQIPARAVIDIDGNLSLGDCNFSARGAAWSLDDFLAHGFAALRAEVHADGLTDLALRGYHTALGACSPAAFHGHSVDLVALSKTETLAPRLAALATPSLFLAGVPDGICAHSRALLDRHHIRWTAIEPAGHWVFIDQPTAVAEAIASFLQTA